MNMSFMLTADQILDESKTVTRRLGWKTLKPRTILQPIRKGQGLKKGEKVQRLGGPIQVVSVRREPLDAMTSNPRYGKRECIAEGFPTLSPRQFVEMFCRNSGELSMVMVTRIEFRYGGFCVECGCDIAGTTRGLCGECSCEDDGE